MEIKERNLIIGVISSIMGIILIILFAPYVFFNFVIYLNIYLLMDTETSLSLSLFILGIVQVLYGYFMIRPPKNLSEKKKVSRGSLAFGIILVIIPQIGIFINTLLLRMYELYNLTRFSLTYLTRIAPYLIIVLIGVTLIIHSKFLKKSLQQVERNNKLAVDN